MVSTADPDATVDLHIVLVEPMYEGNVGATARVCANFGIDDLVLVEGPELTDRANMMAVHAKDLLDRADRVPSLDAALEGTDYSVGFTAETATRGQDHLRSAVTLPEAARRVHAFEGTAALVFGREDDGLTIPELEAVDLVTTIPVDPGYPSMNLSHAVAVALYEIAGRDRYDPPYRPESASRHEMKVLFDTFEHMMIESGFREHKITHAMVCLRRVFGRTRLSTWEYHRIMGVLSRALKAMDAWPESGSLEDVQ